MSLVPRSGLRTGLYLSIGTDATPLYMMSSSKALVRFFIAILCIVVAVGSCESIAYRVLGDVSANRGHNGGGFAKPFRGIPPGMYMVAY